MFRIVLAEQMYHKGIRCTIATGPYVVLERTSLGPRPATSCHSTRGKYDVPFAPFIRRRPWVRSWRELSHATHAYMAVDPRRDHSFPRATSGFVGGG